MTVFLLLLFAHALADYPLQGDFLSKAKNHRQPIPGVPWTHGLLWHAVIHGGFVGIVTGSVALGVAEVAAHMLIDYAKSAGRFRRSIMGGDVPVPRVEWEAWHLSQERLAFHIDQLLHVLCKALWCVLLAVL